MTVKISKDPWLDNGYFISLQGIRGPFKAKGIKEVGNAVEHYFKNHSSKKKDCPLCRAS